MVWSITFLFKYKWYLQNHEAFPGVKAFRTDFIGTMRDETRGWCYGGHPVHIAFYSPVLFLSKHSKIFVTHLLLVTVLS